MLSTVLIIDKRKELSVKYKKSINSSEINSVIARTLKDALILIQTLEPDMIIISDSIEENLCNFCQKIRVLTYNTRPIIIALSKSAEADDRISVLENGADDFISEPVNINEFKSRIKAHLRRDIESNLDTKTLLPNEKYVKKVLKRAMLSENQAVLLANIKNLDKYISTYTELAGDKIIQTFIAIIKSAIDENDFVGQLNDTNFIIITNKYNAEKLAEFLTFAFDTVAPKFYSEQDATRGYMLLKSERYAGMRVNFVSVLISGIVENIKQYSSAEKLIGKLQTINSSAKIPAGSNYLIDRALLTSSNITEDFVFNKKLYINEKDESLYYLIRTSLELQGYDIQEELNFDSTNQPAIIIVDAGDNLEELQQIAHIRKLQNFVNTKIIVTTTTHNKSAILNTGADLYLPKPYEISDLIRWIEYFL